jgi:hydroxymethylbilane synthase
MRIASRNSPLALWQANHVKNAVLRANPSLEVSIVGITTKGDRILDTALSKVGGKGLFVKELEFALLQDKADIAVHSIKDVPMTLPEGLVLPVICERADARDALVSRHYRNLSELPSGARVGTSSLRRSCQLKARYPELEIVDLRGNVNTRLAKLDQGEYDAIILATAGLVRLDMASRIRQKIPVDICLPAVGQGALGIECRAGDDKTLALLEDLHHQNTALAVIAERAVCRQLEGGCQLPVACIGEITGQQVFLRALVGSVDGKTVLYEEIRGQAQNGARLGIELANRLLLKGADKVLATVRR